MAFNNKKNFQPNDKLTLTEKFIENLGANVFVADKTGDVIFANQNSADTYQCTLDELFEFNAFTMQEKGYTDRQPAVKEVLLKKKEIKRYIKTGKDVGMIISCKPIFDENGDVEYAVATSYREEDFLYLLNQVDKQKRKLQETVAYLNKLGQKTILHRVFQRKDEANVRLGAKIRLDGQCRYDLWSFRNRQRGARELYPLHFHSPK